ncbi:MAG: 6-bladed beta-propeller [Gammaproteobacteria bacterium]
MAISLQRCGIGVVLMAFALLTGCAESRSVLRYQAEGAQATVWPPAPETPRYRYVGELTGEENIKTEGGGGIGDLGLTGLKWLVGLFSDQRQAVILQRPQAGVVDDGGRIYVTDVSRQAVYVFDEKVGKLHVWEMALEGTRFEAPIGIALGANGEILVADSSLGRVVRLNREGVPVGSFGKGVLKHPTGLTRDAVQGRIYVADTHEHRIKVFDDAGNLLDTFGSGERQEGQSGFNSPTHLTFANGKLYVADTLNARIQVLAPDGKVLRMFGRRGLFLGDMTRPKGVAVDGAGNVYVVESYYDHLLVFNGEGELLLPIGGGGSGVGEFYLPAGVWTDQRRRIYVADMFNGRIVIFEYLGGGA